MEKKTLKQIKVSAFKGLNDDNEAQFSPGVLLNEKRANILLKHNGFDFDDLRSRGVNGTGIYIETAKLKGKSKDAGKKNVEANDPEPGKE